MGIVTKADCVIFAAGDAVQKEIVRAYLTEETYIIAADAGYAFCKALGYTPNLILGDFDSGACPETDIETLRFNPVKDDTDSAMALKAAIKRGFKKIVLFGGTGSRLDHTFANFDLCAYAKINGADLQLVDNHHRIFALQGETATLQKDTRRYVSVFALGGACTISLKGFFYPLEHHVFEPFCGLGVSNEITEDTAQIVAEKGIALIFVTDKDGERRMLT